MKIVNILDASILAYRIQHSYSKLKNSQGEPSGWIFGFLRFIKVLKRDYPADAYVLAFDSGFPPEYVAHGYKQGRPDTLLGVSVKDALKQFLRVAPSLGFYTVKHPDTEADLLMAQLALHYMPGARIKMFTNDMDMHQLIDERITMINPKYQEITLKDVKEKWFGIYGHKLALFRAIAGDTSDNLRGAPRINKERLAQWVNMFDSLEQFKQAVKIGAFAGVRLTEFDRIKEAAEKIYINHEIMSLYKDKMDFSVEPPAPSPEVFKQLVDEYELVSLKGQDLIL